MVDEEEMTRSSACGCSWADPPALCRGLQAVVLAGPDLSRTLLGSSFHSQACSLLAPGLSLLPAFFPAGGWGPRLVWRGRAPARASEARAEETCQLHVWESLMILSGSVHFPSWGCFSVAEPSLLIAQLS